MIHFNGLTSAFSKFKMWGKRPNCDVCGENPSITNVAEYDYEQFCPTPPCNLVDKIHLPKEIDLTVEDLKSETDDHIIIDVWPKHHFNIVHIENSLNFPLDSLKKNPKEVIEIINSHKKAFILCWWGNASRKATEFLLKEGLKNIYNVRGGITEWIKVIDPSMPLY